MKPEHFNVVMAEGQTKAEIIIREVTTANELPVKPPVKLNIKGSLGSIVEFLSQRCNDETQFNAKRSMILVDRENLTITLIINENDEYLSGKITGALEFHPKFREFGINNFEKEWAPTKLAMMFKMNKFFFENDTDNMTLVTTLMNFKATVNQKVEKSASERGDRTDNFEQIVDSNLPKSFKLKLPVFKGFPAETIEVETLADIDGREVSFILVSPSANNLMESIRDHAIDSEIREIRAVCPSLPIIEQ